MYALNFINGFSIVVFSLLCFFTFIYPVAAIDPLEEFSKEDEISEKAKRELFNLQLIQEIENPRIRAEALRNHLIHYPSGITTELALLNILLVYEKDMQDPDRAIKTAWWYLEGLRTSIPLKKASVKYLLLKTIKESSQAISPILREIKKIEDPILYIFTAELLSKRGILLNDALSLLDTSDSLELSSLPGVTLTSGSADSIKEKMRLSNSIARSRIKIKLGSYQDALEILHNIDTDVPDKLYQVQYLLGLALSGTGRYGSAFDILSSGFHRTWREYPYFLVALEQLYLKKDGHLENLGKDLETNQLAHIGSKVSFEATDYSGQLVKSSELEGRTLIILFWAAWSKQSKDMLGAIENTSSGSLSDDVVLLSFNVSNEDGPDRKSFQDLCSRCRHLKDGKNFVEMFDIRGIPTTLLINQNGMIRYQFRGYRTNFEDAMTKKVKLLSKKGPQVIFPVNVLKELAAAYLDVTRDNMSITPDTEIESNLEKALNLDSKNPEILNELAWFYATHRNNIKEGIRLARKALRYDSFNIAYLDTLAELYYLESNYKKAIKTIKKALDLAPIDPLLAQRLKKYEAAIQLKSD